MIEVLLARNLGPFRARAQLGAFNPPVFGFIGIVQEAFALFPS